MGRVFIPDWAKEDKEPNQTFEDQGQNTPAPPPPKPSLQDQYKAASSDVDVNRAQEEADRNNLTTNLLRSLSQIAAAPSVARGGKGADNSLYDSLIKGNNDRVARAEQARKDRTDSLLTQDKLGQQEKERAHQEKQWSRQEDVNGPAATSAKTWLKAAMIGKAKEAEKAGDRAAADELRMKAKAAGEGMTADEINSQVKLMNSVTSYKDLLDADVKLSTIKANDANRKALTDERRNRQLDLDARKLGDTINPNKGMNKLLADNQKRLNSADRAAALILDDDGNIRNLNSEQMAEAAQAWANMINTNNIVADAAVTRLLPHTAEGKIADVKQWLLNEPTGANQQAFTKLMHESILRERDVAERQLRESQAAASAPFGELRKANPELYNYILTSNGLDPENFDEKGGYHHKGKTALDPKIEASIKATLDQHPGVTREQVIDAAKKKGKVPAGYK